MAQNGSTDLVRRHAAITYVQPARMRGEHTIKINSGILGRSLMEQNILPPNRFPIVCQALRSPKFQRDNRIKLIDTEAPASASSGQSSTITFVYRVEPELGPQSSNSGTRNPPLFQRLYGALRTTYKQLGGGEAFHHAERENWNR